MNSTIEFIENILKYTKRGIYSDTYDELSELLYIARDLEKNFLIYENTSLVRLVNFDPKTEIGKWTFHRILDNLNKQH